MFKKSIKGIKLIDLTKPNDRILIQDNTDIIIDLEKTVFKVNDVIFNISARGAIKSDRKISSLNLLFNKDIYINDSYSIDVNIAISELYKFYSEKSELNRSIFIHAKWYKNNGEGFANLISSVSYNKSGIYKVELSDNKFIIFEEGKVWLDTNFYIN